jgi:hypothetical protein
MMKKKSLNCWNSESGNIVAFKIRLKIKTSSYLKLINYKDREEKEQFEFKDQQSKRFWQQKKQDEMMKEFAKKMKTIWMS